MKKFVIYTAISNGYDILEDPKCVSDNCDYICFTDDLSMKSGVWELRKLPATFEEESFKNRYVKILPHLILPQYEYSIYIDGNIKIQGNIEKLINDYCSNALMATFKHPERNSIYKEARECKKFNLDSTEKIDKQIEKYKKMGYPQNDGLIYGGILIRKHNDGRVIRLMENWWKEVTQESKRDQLSFNFILWRYPIKHNYISNELSPFFSEKFFKIKNHTNKKKTKKTKILNFVRKSSFGNKHIIKLIQSSYRVYKIIAR